MIEDTINECDAECCSSYQMEPYHPIMDFGITKKKQGKQIRSFKSNWFSEYTWLTFCIPRKRVFCFYCRTATSKTLVTYSTKGEISFTQVGFNNWKKAKERFRDHEHSQTHRGACLKHSALQQPSVHSLLNSQKQGDQNKHRQMLFTQLTSLKYLMRQGLAVRGHDEEEGNLSQLLKCRSQDKTDIGEWLKNGTYQSHDINNEIIQLMANQLLRGLLDEIRSAE